MGRAEGVVGPTGTKSATARGPSALPPPARSSRPPVGGALCPQRRRHRWPDRPPAGDHRPLTRRPPGAHPRRTTTCPEPVREEGTMPSVPLDAERLEACVAAAVAAPSFFNSQPWRFRLDPDTVAFEVRADPQRGLRHADPAGRALHLSVGASVFNLRVAVAHFGWSPVVRLLPRPDEPDLLAVVRPTGAGGGHGTEHRGDLYPAIWRRHSSRFPFSARPLPSQARAELTDAAHAEGP